MQGPLLADQNKFFYMVVPLHIFFGEVKQRIRLVHVKKLISLQ